MKEKDIKQTSLYNYSNLFNIHQDLDGNYFYNLANNVIFDEKSNDNLYTEYIPVGGDEWGTISYKAYQTPELWWLICRFNGVQDGLSKPSDFETIKIPTVDFMTLIVNQIKYK